MKAGKLSESILKRSVLRQLHNSAVRAPGVGIDFGAVDASAGKQIVTAEACRAFDTFPEAGVYAALNNLVCSGAKPLGITMTLLLPTSASENDLRAWISAVSRVSEKEQIPVLGGQTEVLRTVTSPQLIVQAVGEADRELFVTAAGAQPDMDVIVTKWVGLLRPAKNYSCLRFTMSFAACLVAPAFSSRKFFPAKRIGAHRSRIRS